MKAKKTSLNSSFYNWIKKVRNADDQLAKLEDDLEYYNAMLIGYNSPSFDVYIKSNNPSGDKRLLYWTFKISDVEDEIKSLKQLKKEYKRFRDGLTDVQKEVIDDYYHNRKTQLKISRSYWYKILNEVSKVSVHY
ncbi:MAG TPA: hypothetical protein GX708_15200 [Gallicola sp.]|nr:hypothetical protein [Gallicola sp.]